MNSIFKKKQKKKHVIDEKCILTSFQKKKFIESKGSIQLVMRKHKLSTLTIYLKKYILII